MQCPQSQLPSVHVLLVGLRCWGHLPGPVIHRLVDAKSSGGDQHTDYVSVHGDPEEVEAAHLGDHREAAQEDEGEWDDHQCAGERDDGSRLHEGQADRRAIVIPFKSPLVDARKQKEVVVHRQRKEEAGGGVAHRPVNAASPLPAEPLEPAVLVDAHQQAVLREDWQDHGKDDLARDEGRGEAVPNDDAHRNHSGQQEPRLVLPVLVFHQHLLGNRCVECRAKGVLTTTCLEGPPSLRLDRAPESPGHRLGRCAVVLYILADREKLPVPVKGQKRLGQRPDKGALCASAREGVPPQTADVAGVDLVRLVKRLMYDQLCEPARQLAELWPERDVGELAARRREPRPVRDRLQQDGRRSAAAIDKLLGVNLMGSELRHAVRCVQLEAVVIDLDGRQRRDEGNKPNAHEKRDHKDPRRPCDGVRDPPAYPHVAACAAPLLSVAFFIE
mmetsp:Transcript_59858/g.165604  ORF Transcript_59858/g.165604 Transcript_59858/m.165604 type:complete len:444 (+) Transcript_59858:85-1416(+)